MTYVGVMSVAGSGLLRPATLGLEPTPCKTRIATRMLLLLVNQPTRANMHLREWLAEDLKGYPSE